MMKKFALPRDWFLILRASLAPVLVLLPYGFDVPAGTELLVMVAVFMVMGNANYILHLHIHRPFTRDKRINLALDLALGAATGMTASNWRIQHLYGHHRGIDLLFRGGCAWELERYSPGRAMSFVARSIWPTFWQPLVISAQKGVLALERRPINYTWAFFEHMALIALVVGLAAIDWRLTVFYLLPLYLLTYVITRYVDYLNHYGCDEQSPDVHEHANNCLSGWFNRLTQNFGYHTAHHLRPGAHWTELPGIHAQMSGRIPDRRKTEVSWSFLCLPYHIYLGLRGRM